MAWVTPKEMEKMPTVQLLLQLLQMTLMEIVPLAGIDFQRALERKAYKEGAGLVPLQKYGDFKNNVKTTDLGTITPNIKGKYTLSNLNNIFS